MVTQAANTWVWTKPAHLYRECLPGHSPQFRYLCSSDLHEHMTSQCMFSDDSARTKWSEYFLPVLFRSILVKQNRKKPTKKKSPPPKKNPTKKTTHANLHSVALLHSFGLLERFIIDSWVSILEWGLSSDPFFNNFCLLRPFETWILTLWAKTSLGRLQCSSEGDGGCKILYRTGEARTDPGALCRSEEASAHSD